MEKYNYMKNAFFDHLGVILEDPYTLLSAADDSDPRIPETYEEFEKNLIIYVKIYDSMKEGDIENKSNKKFIRFGKFE